MRRRVVLLTVVFSVALCGSVATSAPSAGAPLRFAVSFDRNRLGHAVDGRMFVIVSRSSDSEPRFQIDITDGVPFWGRDVQGLRPGQQAILDGGQGVYGYPLPSITDLPAGNYVVQAFLNVYTTFHRSDGSVVRLHLPCGDGGFFLDSPGNLYSTPTTMHLDPSSSGTVELSLNKLIEPADPVPPGGTCQQGNPADTAHVKHVKIRSRLLSAFWGHPMYIGANVLLPEGYEPKGSTRYPVIWHQTHFPFGNPFGFDEQLKDPFSRWWVSVFAPRVIAVDIRHENPYYDDSYAVNSANLGPYGDAITKELMPYIDAHFRTVPHRWARVVEGGSTGGWEAMAQQVFYPRLYSGAWVFYPDPMDFRAFQLVDIYGDPNAYVTPHKWVDVPRPSAREVPGDTLWTMEEENHWELALGPNGRSQLGQWDIWQAVNGPQGADGYPAPIWDKLTGAIDHGVAHAWQPKDIRRYLAEHWPTLGPLLSGRLRFFVGDDDTYFLNNSVELMQRFLAQLDPPAKATFRYGHNQPHGWSPYTTQQLIQVMADSMADRAPHGASVEWWRPGSGTGMGGPAPPEDGRTIRSRAASVA
jgi:Putative esterase